MNNPYNISRDDHQNDVVDQHVREAYGQIQFRDEWADRVRRMIASENARQATAANGSVSESLDGRALSRLLRRKSIALAATILLAVVGAYWLMSTPDRPKPSNSMDTELAKRITEPIEELSEELSEMRENAEPSTHGLQQIDSVTGTPGYLAARLTDDPEFEIYMVLPKDSVRKF